MIKTDDLYLAITTLDKSIIIVPILLLSLLKVVLIALSKQERTNIINYLPLISLFAIFKNTIFVSITMGLLFLSYIKDLTKIEVSQLVAYSASFFIAVTLMMILTGVATPIIADERSNRIALLFTSHHTLAFITSFTILNYLYSKDKLDYRHLMPTCLLLTVIYFFVARSFSVIIALFLLPLVYIYLDNLKERGWLQITKYIPYFYLLISTFLAFTLRWGDFNYKFYTFKQRFLYPLFLVENQGLKWFGYNMDVDLLMHLIKDERPFDNSYLYLLIQFGLFSIIAYGLIRRMLENVLEDKALLIIMIYVLTVD